MTTLTKPLPMPSAPPRSPELELELELDVDERGARRSLRTQIARLELHLARTLAAEGSAGPVEVTRSTTGSARLLTLGELERTRDALAGALHTARRRQEEQEDAHAQTRRRLEEARQDPRRHKHLRIALADLGLPGCGHYRVRPRFGVLGMLMGWWEVKLSGGCPLPVQPWFRASPPAPSRHASAPGHQLVGFVPRPAASRSTARASSASSRTSSAAGASRTSAWAWPAHRLRPSASPRSRAAVGGRP